MGRKEKDESECLFCLRKLTKNIYSLKSATCKANSINEKLMTLVSPAEYRNLSDTSLFPDPRICNSCCNVINSIHRNALKIENFVGKSINFHLESEEADDGAQREIWHNNTEEMAVPEKRASNSKETSVDADSTIALSEIVDKESSQPVVSETVPTKRLPARKAKQNDWTENADSGDETDNYYEIDDLMIKDVSDVEEHADYETETNAVSQPQTWSVKARSTKYSSQEQKLSLKLVKTGFISSENDISYGEKLKELKEKKKSETLEKITGERTKRKRGRNWKSEEVPAIITEEMSLDHSTKQNSQISSSVSSPSSSLSKVDSLKPKQSKPRAKKSNRKKDKQDSELLASQNSTLSVSRNALLPKKLNEPNKDKSTKNDKKEILKCEKCGKGFASKYLLSVHAVIHSGEKPYKCPYPGCDKEYAYETSLNEHRQCHENKLPHVCPYDVCGKEFIRLRDLRSHITIHTGERPFKCEFDGCTKAFRLRNQYYIHRRMHTGERPFKCHYNGCERTFMRRKSLQIHEISHSSEQPFCCEECGRRFSHIRYFKHHKLSHARSQEPPPEKNVPCQVCGKMFNSKLNVRRHFNLVHKGIKQKKRDDQIYVCEINGCNRSFRWKSCIVRHKALKHRKEDYRHQGKLVKYVCSVEECKEEFNRHNFLREHMAEVHGKRIESGDPKTFKEWMCFECGMAVTKKQMSRHKDTYHSLGSMFNVQEQGIFECMTELCGLKFGNAEELKTHIPSHVGKPPYTCLKEGCKKTFLLKANLDLHMMVHNNIKPFQCSYTGCDKSFVTQLCLMRHSKEHNDGLHVCPVETCGAKFRSMNNAGGHLAAHRGENPYLCGLCGAVFNTYNVWARHKRRHAGELAQKVNKCPKCGKCFAVKSELKRHLPVHSKEKPYICEVCGMGYASKAGYTCHMRTHEEKKYFCDVEGCGKGFSLPLTLKRHQVVHEKPSNLCSSCGKILKLSLKKHKCATTKIDTSDISESQPVESEHTQVPVQTMEVHNPVPHQFQSLQSSSLVIQSQTFQEHHPPLQLDQQQLLQQMHVHQQDQGMIQQQQQHQQQSQQQQQQQQLHHQQQNVQLQQQQPQQQQRPLLPQLHTVLPFQHEIQQPIEQIQPLIMSHDMGGPITDGGGSGSNNGASTRQSQLLNIPVSSIAMSNLPIPNLHIPSNMTFPSLPISSLPLSSFQASSLPVTSLPAVSSISLTSLPMPTTLPNMPLTNTPLTSVTLPTTQPLSSIPFSTTEPSPNMPIQSLPHYMKQDYSNNLGNYMVIYDSTNTNGI